MSTATSNPTQSLLASYGFPSADSWDSYEGVPDFLPTPTPQAKASAQSEAARRGRVARVGHDALEWLGPLLPGVALATFIVVACTAASGWLGRHVFRVGDGSPSPVSAVMLAVATGLALRNLVGVPKTYEAGLKWCTRAILRVGIVLMGLGLYVGDVAKIGLGGLPVIVGCIVATLLMTAVLNRLLGLPRRLGILIGVGTSICGVSAIVATAPAIDADEDETSYAVACVTIFGLFALFAYPWLAHALFGDQFRRAGVFLGTSVHDMAQCTGAAAMFKQQFGAAVTLDYAVTVKMLRNLGMSVLIPAVAIYYHRQNARRATAASEGDVERIGGASGIAPLNRASAHRQRWHEVVPGFVLGFVALAALRSALDYANGPTPRLEGVYDAAKMTSHWCFGLAMAAVGLGTGLARLRGLGWRPFTVGCFAAAMVGVVSWALVHIFIPA